MRRYVIDSDMLIYFMKGQKEVVNAFIKIAPSNLYTTRINYTELLYGAYNSDRVEKNLEKVKGFLAHFQILEFDQTASKIFAETKAQLKREGNLIQDMDLMIAAITMSKGYTLVSNNQKHFQRIKKLDLINWME